MRQVRCVDLGASSCGARFKAEAVEDPLRTVSAHFSEKHAIKVPTATIMRYASKQVTK